jgi:arylsulfatase A-like enzyme
MRATTCGLLLLAGGLAGCGRESAEPQRFQSLLDLRPERTGAGMTGLTPGPRLAFEPRPDGSGVVAVHTLTAQDWLPVRDGRWRLQRPLGFPPARLELLVDGTELDGYFREESFVLSRPLAGDGPPRAARLRVQLSRAAPGEFGGELLPLWPGEEVAYTLDIGPERALSFQSLLLGGFGQQLAGEVVFTLELDGERLAEERLTPGRAPGQRVHLIDLPPRTGARLVLRARGAPVPFYLLSPTLVPRVRGTPSARPWPDARPDLVIFLADTFRADLLAVHGGDPALTPHLNALAARGRRFLAARSPSTWTLPAHASLFTGLWPGQHGAETEDATFDPTLVTLAEALRAAGYRTGAVTQGGFVTRSYGLDQGFEYFFEQNFPGGPLGSLLDAARDFLAADDGRPVFLFVHTYRVHSPYRPDVDERKQRYVELYREASARGFLGPKVAQMPPEITAEMRGLYDQGASELDAEFGPWFEELERSGRLARGLFVFTSDHGEAFHEHGRFLHGDAPHEEVARIPLFLVGAGVEPGDVTFGASLVDLYPTLMVRAGLAPPAGLAGTDLFTLAGERMLFSHTRMRGTHHLGIIEGSRKLLATRPGEDVSLPRDVLAVYDLTRDPLERAGVGADQAVDFLGSAAPAWAAASRLRAPLRPIALDQAKLDELKALGYGE